MGGRPRHVGVRAGATIDAKGDLLVGIANDADRQPHGRLNDQVLTGQTRRSG
jgi:hypothetical protein